MPTNEFDSPLTRKIPNNPADDRLSDEDHFERASSTGTWQALGRKAPPPGEVFADLPAVVSEARKRERTGRTGTDLPSLGAVKKGAPALLTPVVPTNPSLDDLEDPLEEVAQAWARAEPERKTSAEFLGDVDQAARALLDDADAALSKPSKPKPDRPDEALRDATGMVPRLNIRPLFELMVQKRASDLFFSAGAAIQIKIEGRVLPVSKTTLTSDQVRQAVHGLMTQTQITEFEKRGELDFAIPEDGIGRFRVAVFNQRGNPAMVLRYISAEIPKIDDLHLPPSLRELVMHKRGLILVVGATGSGKSTTLAAMIDHRNESLPGHILTVEDPIEYLHPNKRSIVNQREVGIDTSSFHTALRSAMRAAPDVILIGEIRDRESMEHALAFAGTGHLCLATLHANNAAETLDRIVNMFSREQHAQIYLDLSQYLRAIVAQRLVSGLEGLRLPAVELLFNTPHVQQLIQKGDVSAIKVALEESQERGMFSFDTALLRLYKDKRISLEEALSHADSRTNMEARVNFG